MFLEVISYLDETGHTIIRRMPEAGPTDIKLGAQLIVQENQAAIFFRDGKALDTFGPGRHTLSTQNLPVIGKLLNLVFKDNVFQACVYYVSLKTFINLKWGTPSPVTVPDSVLGTADVRAFGNYSMKIEDPRVFVAEIGGTQGITTTQGVQDHFRGAMINEMIDLIGDTNDSIINLSKNAKELSTALKARCQSAFQKYGVTLTDFFIGGLTPTDETKAALGKYREKFTELSIGRQGAQLAKDMGQDYTRYRAMEAMDKAAGQPAGMAGQMMGAGMGLGMGMAMPQMMGGPQAMYGVQPGMYGAPVAAPPPMMPPPLPAAVAFYAAIGGGQAGPFDLAALAQKVREGAVTPETLVWKPGMAAWTKAREVPETASIFAPAPPPLPGMMPPPPPFPR